MKKKYPTWKYKYFRLRYVDTWYLSDEKDRQWGIGWYPNSARSDMGGHVQIGIITGRKEYIFDLWKLK